MLTITNEQIRRLSDYHDTLGGMLLTLAFPPNFENGDVKVRTYEGWEPCAPGKVALARYGDIPLQGYTQPGSSIILTLAKVDPNGETHIHAEGDGWALETDGPYSGWAESGHYARTVEIPARDDLKPPFEIGISKYPMITMDPPWHMPERPAPMTMQMDVEEPEVHGSWNEGIPFLQTIPTWLRPGYDWDAAITRDPGNSLSRIQVLARKTGVDWEGIAGKERPTHLMMNRIEAALGIETTAADWDSHRLPLGARIAAAEQAVASGTSA